MAAMAMGRAASAANAKRLSGRVADMTSDAETPLPGGGRNLVTRRGDVVFRETGPWARSVHSLLRHLERAGFDAAPRVVGTGFDATGRETLSFVEGEFVHPHAWPDDAALHALGVMLARLHDAARSFVPPADAQWRDWFGRTLGGGTRVFGHGDAAPWNIVARNAHPVALIDWETAGPIDPLIECAQAGWLNAQLHDDDVAEIAGLPDAATRLGQLRAFAEGYGLSRAQRSALPGEMAAFAAHAAAAEARDAHVTRSGGGRDAAWGIAWRARAAAWMLRNRADIARALR